MDDNHFWSNFTTGATISNGTEFGKGDGHRLMDNVNCNQTKEWVLLECDSGGVDFLSCSDHDAGVRCRDEQRVRNVAACIHNTSNASSVYTVLVTWEQNLTVKKPTSFKVECYNEQHSIIIKVGNKMLNTQLGGLFSPSSHNCCVTAVYPPYYEDKEICTGINATSKVMCTDCTNSTNVKTVAGVLGFITAVLTILLALSVITFLYQLRQRFCKRLIPQRYIRLLNNDPSGYHGELI